MPWRGLFFIVMQVLAVPRSSEVMARAYFLI